MKRYDEKANEIIREYVEHVFNVIMAITSGNITLSCDDLISIEFLIRRFGLTVVIDALDYVGAVKQEDFIPELRRLCAEKFIEVYGVK